MVGLFCYGAESQTYYFSFSKEYENQYIPFIDKNRYSIINVVLAIQEKRPLVFKVLY